MILKNFIQIVKLAIELNRFMIHANKLLTPPQRGRIPLTMELITTVTDHNLRCVEFYLENNEFLTGDDIAEGIYNTVFVLDAFKKLGTHKMVIVVGKDENFTFNIHPNVLVSNDSSYLEYFNAVKDLIANRYDESGYVQEITPYFIVKVWDMDHVKNRNIKTTRNAQGRTINSLGKKINKTLNSRMYSTSAIVKSGIDNNKKDKTEYQLHKEWLETLEKENPTAKDFITHYKPGFEDTKNDRFSTLDLETIKLPLHNNIQIPVCITHTSTEHKHRCNYYQIDTNNLNSADIQLINSDVTNMFKKLMNSITSRKNNRFNNRVIFVHNLGGFDGIFIHKALVEIYGDKIECLIDDGNNYISIIYKGELVDTNNPENFDEIKHWTQLEHKQNKFTIEFKDSCRLFPVSLDQLCQVFGVEGKISKYNPEFNEISIFSNDVLLKQFKEYAIQDTVALFQALTKARELYSVDWDVDIIYCYSAANLSLRVYRHQFMNERLDYISVLSNSQDKAIRPAYFGGATDYYKNYGENLHYYDVNSLYPYAMLKPMPYRLINTIKVDKDFTLESFYGFVQVKVTCPYNITIPLLPHKVNGKTVFPRGTWVWTYFSEELLEVMKHGYIIEPVIGSSALEFESTTAFNGYIDAFYAIKANSKGAQRWIAKMHLNSLYGVFGRKTDISVSSLIETKDLAANSLTKLIYSYTKC